MRALRDVSPEGIDPKIERGLDVIQLSGGEHHRDAALDAGQRRRGLPLNVDVCGDAFRHLHRSDAGRDPVFPIGEEISHDLLGFG